ncbi:MAG: nuclear transport factor 2 family protein [Deltaproteobacteria bacterium]
MTSANPSAMDSDMPAGTVMNPTPANGRPTTGSEQTVAPLLPEMPEQAAPQEMGPLQPALPVVENADHAQLLSSPVPQLAANKRLVYDMWRTLIEARDTQAAERFLAESYIQHNPNADTGRAGVLAFFAGQGPAQTVQERVRRPLVAIVAERDYVAVVQVDAQTQPRPYSTTWFDLFRIEDGVIAEHWDHGRLPADGTPRGYVPPAATADQEPAVNSSDLQLATNKRLVYDMWRTVLDAQQVEEAPRFLAPGYVQHNPQANTGLQGFLAFFRQFAQPRQVQPTIPSFIQMVAEGDLVVLATVRTYTGAGGTPYTTTWFDMFRTGGGLLVEHWDTATLQ